MGRVRYSVALVNGLYARIRGFGLHVPFRVDRYESGTVLDLDLTTAWPEARCRASFLVEKFVGGGFAGQVYRCRFSGADDLAVAAGAGLQLDGTYAVKILVPPSRFAAGFRNWVYGLAFQAPFSAQVVASACRSGLLWPKVLRLAAQAEFGRADAIADTYASFYDANFGAFGEVREWVEGRGWRLEADLRPALRKQWRTMHARDAGSAEYVAKRQFMDRLVRMMHAMGAPELARQYVWSTCKSQPNVLKRFGFDDDPGGGLCAVDFRAGLALIPLLPMSPGDFPLIWQGLRRGSLAQFDRCDFVRLRAYVESHPEAFKGNEGLIDALQDDDRRYRRSMPDITHQGLRLCVDRGLRGDVRHGLVEAYRNANWIDDEAADRLLRSKASFALFYLLGAIPLFGRFFRGLSGQSVVRSHVARMFSSFRYFRMSGQATAAHMAILWHQSGRVGERHAQLLADHVGLFWLERLTVRILPIFLHRWITEPLWVWRCMRGGIRYVYAFLQDAAFRENWLREQVQMGLDDGMLLPADANKILAQIDDPYIAKYLKSVGVHLACIPITQIVSVTVGAILAAKIYAHTGDFTAASIRFGVVLAAFQVFPISPGSIVRGLYVVYLMIRERNFRDYVVAAPLSFVKYIGYLAFPIQMATAYPVLSQFMASRWATGAVHIIPVFGEQGALLEHAIFNGFYNRPRIWGSWLRARIKGVLDVWFLAGLVLGGWMWWRLDFEVPGSMRSLVNICMWVVCLHVLPRFLFYPLLRKRDMPDHHG
ncbi:MAG: hypothetical protein ACNA71_01390 [Kiritimatiellia bacterium]